MNGANKKSEAELNQLCQVFLFNLQFIKAIFMSIILAYINVFKLLETKKYFIIII